MPPAELCLSTFSAVLQTYEGRDKFARLFAMGSRVVMGLTAGTSGSRMDKMNANARNMNVTISGARRTFRWGRELPVLLSIPKALEVSDPLERFLDLLQKATALVFFFLDRLGWLKQIRRGMQRGARTIQLGLKWLTVSSLIAVLLGVRKLQLLWAVADGADQHRVGEQRQCLHGIVRNGFLALQVAHLSRWWETSDVLVGLLGVATSAMDIVLVWPQKPSVALAAQGMDRKSKATDGNMEHV